MFKKKEEGLLLMFFFSFCQFSLVAREEKYFFVFDFGIKRNKGVKEANWNSFLKEMRVGFPFAYKEPEGSYSMFFLFSIWIVIMICKVAFL